MSEYSPGDSTPRVWQVGALCRAVADALEARFNPVAVLGEISGLTRASSGHCYFSLKDESGQIRCAMFRRAVSALDFSPRDGELVEVRGRLGVYEARGDLQLIVESMSRAGKGALFEQFLRLRAKLDAEGLFATERKKPLPQMPRAIGVVTSLGAAALHDVVTALRRRVPHIPVVISPAAVQGTNSPQELIHALSSLYQRCNGNNAGSVNGLNTAQRTRLVMEPIVDVILLVRGGGSMEDLWAFNDERLARTLILSPVPVVCGVGHETDFTIADFVSDLRAPTPTAAAELVAQPREVLLTALEGINKRLQDAVFRHVDRQGQRLDLTASRLGRPSSLVGRQNLRLASSSQRLQSAARLFLQKKRQRLTALPTALPVASQRGLTRKSDRLHKAALRLGLLDPSLVLGRGYAWLSDAQGRAITSVKQTHVDQHLKATLADGEVDMNVLPPN